MRATTVNPPFLKNYSRQSRSPCVAKSGTLYYAYYLAYAGCSLEMGGHQVQHIDSIVDELDINDTVARMAKFSPELVIVDTSTPSIESDLDFCKTIRASLPNAFIVCVGTFPSKNTDEFFSLSRQHGDAVNAVLLGEYEETVLELADALENSNDWKAISGLAYKSDAETVNNGGLRKTTEEFLNKLPFVSEFYLKHFGETGIRRHFYASINWPYIQILTSRGCPYKCSFCNIPSIGSYRVRSIKSVVEEFRFIKTNMPFIKEVFIEDDTFPINYKRTDELCNQLIAENVVVPWSCNARVNTRKDTLKIMKRAGCRLTCVGFESPTESSLHDISKKTSLKEQEDYMNNANSVGIKVNGCFILGLPGDTEDTIHNTIEYAKKLLPNTVQFYPHMLYPGTKSFEWAEENGHLAHKDWKLWLTKDGFHNTPLRTSEISSERLLELADLARLQYYGNPRYIFKMLLQSIKSPKEFQRMMIAGKTFFPILAKYVFKRK